MRPWNFTFSFYIGEKIIFARRFYAPFITFTYKATPRVAETAIRKPWKVAKYYAMWKGMEEASRLFLGETKEQLEEEKRLRPDYMQNIGGLPGAVSHVKMPWYDEDGDSVYLDLSFVLPWGDINSTWDNMGILPRMIMPTHPILTAMSDVRQNIDAFTNRPIAKKYEDGGEVLIAYAGHLMKQAAPGVPIPGMMTLLW